jgi:hypothetical protein
VNQEKALTKRFVGRKKDKNEQNMNKSFFPRRFGTEL